MDVVQDMVAVVAKRQLERNHAVSIDAWLPGKVIVSSQAFSSHAVEQLMRTNWNKHGTCDLQTNMLQHMLDTFKNPRHKTHGELIIKLNKNTSAVAKWQSSVWTN